MKIRDKKMLDTLRDGPLSHLSDLDFKMIRDAVDENGIDGVTGYAASMIADAKRRMAFDMKQYKVNKAKDVSVGDVVLYAVSKPPQATTYATGKVESIKTSGKVSISGSDESEEASEDKPVATIRVYAETESGLQETDRRVIKPVSQLRMTDKKEVDKHGDHDQSTHGDRYNADDSEGESAIEGKNPKPYFAPSKQDDSEGEFEDSDYDDPAWMDTMDYPRRKKG